MISPSFSGRVLLAVFAFFTTSCFVKTLHSNKSCEHNYDCKRSGYDHCCIGGNTRYCSSWRYCDGHCQYPSDCGISQVCVEGYCTKSGTLFCTTDQDCYNANTGTEHDKYVECFNYQCLPSKCKLCPMSCKSGECERAKSTDDSHSFSPASIIGFTAVVLIGSCIACTLYCGCARRRQQPPMSTPAAYEIDNEQQEHGTSPQSPPLHPDAPPPYHSLEMIDMIQVEPPPPSYAEAVRNSQNNLENI